MTTLLDVARKAGVSKSTVSNVVRGAAIVADPTRLRVERAIRETGYQPNMIARALKARISHAMAIVVPDLTNPFFGELVVSTERAARALGYGLVAANTECLASLEAEAARALIARRVDGVIIAGMSRASRLPGLLLDREIPVVLASFGGVDDARVGIVEHDDTPAMEAIVDHLCGLGHRRMAFVAPTFREHAGERRRSAFRAALRRRGLKMATADVATAFVAHDDILALATIDRLERAGRTVPHAVSVVGYDDIPMAGHHRIGLTTVHSDANLMGRHAVELLAEAARGARHVARRIVLSNPLIVRTTTAEVRR
jgi:LacI family transcriptional regulator